jgi:Uma2 family endonuclease
MSRRHNGKEKSRIATLVRRENNEYPTTDGKPMAETDIHRDLMLDLIRTLEVYYADKKRVYVSGNLLVFYEPDNKRKHVSPDVFVVKGVKKQKRDNYLVWKEKPIAFVIELTSSSTKKEDTEKKFKLYQDTLKVSEYFLFDPKGDYLRPRLKGYRLVNGVYQPIEEVDERLPSEVIGLHLQRDRDVLRLWNPATDEWLPTPSEMVTQAQAHAEQAEERAEFAEGELERLRQELADLRRKLT